MPLLTAGTNPVHTNRLAIASSYYSDEADTTLFLWSEDHRILERTYSRRRRTWRTYILQDRCELEFESEAIE